jgi:hypothetical protein
MPECTGKSLLKNPQLFQLITDSLAAGESLLSVSKKFGVSRDTIRAAMAQPKASHFAKATAAKLERLADEVLDSYRRDLTRGKVSPNAKPLHAGIFLTKRGECLEESGDKAPQEMGPSVTDVLDELLQLCSPQPVQVNVLVGHQERQKPVLGDS